MSIFLHWVTAMTVFGLFGLGLYMVELGYYDRWYRDSLSLHKSIGMCLLGLLLIRWTWRCVNRKPNALPGKKWEQFAAHEMHRALYAVMFALMVSGYLISTANGQAIPVFELISIPALPWAIKNQEDIAGDIHALLAWSLIGMVCIHALAAIKHHIVNKNEGLMRMLKARR